MTEYRRNTGIDVWHMLAHCRQCIANQWSAIIGFDHRQTDFTFGKIYHLQRTRVLNQSINAIDNQLLWRNQMVDRHCVRLEKFICIADIIRRANSGDTIGGIKE